MCKIFKLLLCFGLIVPLYNLHGMKQASSFYNKIKPWIHAAESKIGRAAEHIQKEIKHEESEVISELDGTKESVKKDSKKYVNAIAPKIIELLTPYSAIYQRFCVTDAKIKSILPSLIATEYSNLNSGKEVVDIETFNTWKNQASFKITNTFLGLIAPIDYATYRFANREAFECLENNLAFLFVNQFETYAPEIIRRKDPELFRELMHAGHKPLSEEQIFGSKKAQSQRTAVPRTDVPKEARSKRTEGKASQSKVDIEAADKATEDLNKVSEDYAEVIKEALKNRFKSTPETKLSDNEVFERMDGIRQSAVGIAMLAKNPKLANMIDTVFKAAIGTPQMSIGPDGNPKTSFGGIAGGIQGCSDIFEKSKSANIDPTAYVSPIGMILGGLGSLMALINEDDDGPDINDMFQELFFAIHEMGRSIIEHITRVYEALSKQIAGLEKLVGFNQHQLLLGMIAARNEGRDLFEFLISKQEEILRLGAQHMQQLSLMRTEISASFSELRDSLKSLRIEYVDMLLGEIQAALQHPNPSAQNINELFDKLWVAITVQASTSQLTGSSYDEKSLLSHVSNFSGELNKSMINRHSAFVMPELLRKVNNLKAQAGEISKTISDPIFNPLLFENCSKAYAMQVEFLCEKKLLSAQDQAVHTQRLMDLVLITLKQQDALSSICQTNDLKKQINLFMAKRNVLKNEINKFVENWQNVRTVAFRKWMTEYYTQLDESIEILECPVCREHEEVLKKHDALVGTWSQDECGIHSFCGGDVDRCDCKDTPENLANPDYHHQCVFDKFRDEVDTSEVKSFIEWGSYWDGQLTHHRHFKKDSHVRLKNQRERFLASQKRNASNFNNLANRQISSCKVQRLIGAPKIDELRYRDLTFLSCYAYAKPYRTLVGCPLLQVRAPLCKHALSYFDVIEKMGYGRIEYEYNIVNDEFILYAYCRFISRPNDPIKIMETRVPYLDKKDRHEKHGDILDFWYGGMWAKAEDVLFVHHYPIVNCPQSSYWATHLSLHMPPMKAYPGMINEIFEEDAVINPADKIAEVQSVMQEIYEAEYMQLTNDIAHEFDKSGSTLSKSMCESEAIYRYICGCLVLKYGELLASQERLNLLIDKSEVASGKYQGRPFTKLALLDCLKRFKTILPLQDEFKIGENSSRDITGGTLSLDHEIDSNLSKFPKPFSGLLERLGQSIVKCCSYVPKSSINLSEIVEGRDEKIEALQDALEEVQEVLKLQSEELAAAKIREEKILEELDVSRKQAEKIELLLHEALRQLASK